MTTTEFSNQFTTLLNSYRLPAEFGESSSKFDIILDEYEKSVYLTQAQEIIVKAYFDKTLNQQGKGFDDSSRRQLDFSTLLETVALIPSNLEITLATTSGSTTTPFKVLFILDEELFITKNGATTKFVSVPINYKEYSRQMSKPYSQPLKHQCWRVLSTTTSNNTKCLKEKLILNKTAQDLANGGTLSYNIRYIRKPVPIILEDGITIDGVSSTSECELDSSIHLDILNKAVELVYATRAPRSTEKQQEQPKQQ